VSRGLDGVVGGDSDSDDSESDDDVGSVVLAAEFLSVSGTSDSVEDSATTGDDDESSSSGSDASGVGVGDGIIVGLRVRMVIARGSTETMSPGFSLILALVCTSPFKRTLP